jgi:hypothetical protein
MLVYMLQCNSCIDCKPYVDARCIVHMRTQEEHHSTVVPALLHAMGAVSDTSNSNSNSLSKSTGTSSALAIIRSC